MAATRPTASPVINLRGIQVPRRPGPAHATPSTHTEQWGPTAAETGFDGKLKPAVGVERYERSVKLEGRFKKPVIRALTTSFAR